MKIYLAASREDPNAIATEIEIVENTVKNTCNECGQELRVPQRNEMAGRALAKWLYNNTIVDFFYGLADEIRTNA